MRRWWGTLALAGLIGCRSPTQIDVVVSTNVACAQVSGTSLTAGTLGEIESIPATSTTANCMDERIGSVVLLPSGSDGALVGFKVVTAINGATIDQCTPDDAGAYGPSCIVARRAIRYLPHTPLTVDVLMSGACAGKACNPDSTCVEGTCVPATIADPTLCEGNGCTEQVLEPAGGVPDATAPEAGADASGDATLINDGAGDAPIADAPSDGPVDASDDSPMITYPVIDSGCDLGGALAGAAWPMEDFCPSHRNHTSFVGPLSTPTTTWTHPFGGQVLAAPSIGPDGTLYVASRGTGNQNAVYALAPLTGGKVWTYAPDSGAGFATMPVLAADGTVRVLDQNLGTYAELYIDGGAPRLVAPLQASGGSPFYVRGGMTIVGDGTLYTSDNDSNLLQFDDEGVVAWSLHGVSSDYVFPTIAADGTVLTTTFFVNATSSDGGLLWVYDGGANQQLTTVAVALDGTLRVLSPPGVLYALEANGAYKWSVQTESNNASQLAVADDGTTYIGAADDLTAWDSSGNAAGSYPGPCAQPVIDGNGDVYDVCDGVLLKLDATLTTKKWSLGVSLDPAQLMSDSPVIGPGNTIYLSYDTENSDLPDGGPPDMILGFAP